MTSTHYQDNYKLAWTNSSVSIVVAYLSRRSILVAASNINDCLVCEENAITRSNDETGTRVHTILSFYWHTWAYYTTHNQIQHTTTIIILRQSSYIQDKFSHFSWTVTAVNAFQGVVKPYKLAWKFVFSNVMHNLVLYEAISSNKTFFFTFKLHLQCCRWIPWTPG